MQQSNLNNTQENLDAFQIGKVVVFDKPLNWTSFDMVNKVRYLLRHYRKLRKIKVGHAGTLDPLATGVLIICTGRMTKQITTFQEHDKEYIATVRFGATTPSFDLETMPENFKDISHITRNDIQQCIATFVGQQIQYPPVYSAKKIDGKRAFVAAHEGRADEVKMRPQQIEIMGIEIVAYNDETKETKLKVNCSKGTYIRSLAHDIGQRMGVGAYLAGLRRTRIGNVLIENAISIEDFEKSLQQSQE